MVTISGGPVAWRCSQLPKTCGSTAHAEYCATKPATIDAVFFGWLMDDLRVPRVKPIPMLIDNKAAKDWTDGKGSGKAKRVIENGYFYTMDHVRSKDVIFEYAESSQQPADILTKALTPAKHVRARELLLQLDSGQSSVTSEE